MILVMLALETTELLAESFLPMSALSGLGSPQGIWHVLLSHRSLKTALRHVAQARRVPVTQKPRDQS
ncbi:hypothetical protein N7471_012527 [Penicillium samsonianum]|uniref:uncharacterized protein n=1 Tax=Penicillium samsonianum TaxID=1882272 RepID=UPI002547A368|nr:uncharacterized protein N7471_012527 [Penicillium samsonianum]KAJ6125210.1 hypothetical protein N7471_012527 [Penicillium samsonianum]